MSVTNPDFKLLGFADEAGDTIQEQIRATKELGWTCIEARSINVTNLTDIPDEAFESVQAALASAGFRIDCFGSAVANWAKDPRSEEDFHIKDVRFIRPTETIFNDLDHCWPGEGEGKVAEVLREALVSGFKGTFSIEPHLASVYHAPGGEHKQCDPYASYVEYGRRTMALLDKARLASESGSAML